jgi:outer membrane protein OmpA-like peptidoglycan-associated protein
LGGGLVVCPFPLPAGSSYYYWIEAVRPNGLLATQKKLFTTDPEREESAEAVVIRFPAVNFNYNSAALKSQAYLTLRKVADLLRQYPGKKVRIEGHTDNTGNRQANLGLSLQRASAVGDFLTGVEGFETGLFELKGLADTAPAAPNDSEQNRFRNRRVEIIIEK